MGKLLVLFALFNLSAFFSGSETAFFSLDELSLRGEGGLVGRLMKNRERLLTTVLLGNEVVNVAASSVSASLFMDAFGEKWVGASVFVTTFFLLIYGELLPKTMAVRYNRVWAQTAAPFLFALSFALAPLRVLLEGVGRLTTCVVGREEVVIKEEDFKFIVDEAKSKGELEERERRMIYQVFEFTELQVKEIMVPEPDVFMVDVGVELSELERMLHANRFSKIPVYEGSRDNVLGYVKITDLLPVFKGMEKATLRELLRPCYFVPETKSVQELLREFQMKRIDIAMVVNEYGALEGIVTLEDILEELVGEIRDEYDSEGPAVEEVEGGYLVDAAFPLDDFCELLGMEVPDMDVETVGGFVLHLFGRVPARGESVEHGAWRFTVEEAAKRRIKKVRVERL